MTGKKAAPPAKDTGWRYVMRWVRLRRDWRQQQAADACGISRSQWSLYEQGVEVPSRRTLRKVARGSGISLVEMELMRPLLTRSVEAGLLPAGLEVLEAGGGADPAEPAFLATIVAVAEAALGRIGAELAAVREPAALGWEAAGAWADAAWAAFLTYEAAERAVLVDHGPSFRGWAFCARLFAESEAAAPRDATLTLDLARLGRRAADLTPDAGLWRTVLQGHAHAVLGNAWRVAGDLSASERAFAAAKRLLALPTPDPGPLDPTRPLDLEASLRRAQQRYAEALALIGRALAKAKDAPGAARLWLKRSAILHRKGDFADAITDLKRAAALMDPKREPHLLFGARFNLAATLLDLGRTAEAAALLPEVRALAGKLGHRLDLCRLRWLEAKVLFAQDRLDEAAQALGEAHQAFVDQQIAYDAAFTALDLAQIHLRRGKTAEVRELALATMEVLRAQQVAGGFLAGFQLFCRAAEQDAATAELVRRTARELEKARVGE